MGNEGHVRSGVGVVPTPAQGSVLAQASFIYSTIRLRRWQYRK
jgi:hypothetical protein